MDYKAMFCLLAVLWPAASSSASPGALSPLEISLVPTQELTYLVEYKRHKGHQTEAGRSAALQTSVEGLLRMEIRNAEAGGVTRLRVYTTITAGTEAQDKAKALGALPCTGSCEVSFSSNTTWRLEKPLEGIETGGVVESLMNRILGGLYVCLPPIPGPEVPHSSFGPVRWMAHGAGMGAPLEMVAERQEFGFVLLGVQGHAPFVRLTVEIIKGRVVEGQMVDWTSRGSGARSVTDVYLIEEKVPHPFRGSGSENQQ